MLLVQAHKILYLLYMRATLGHWDKTAAHLFLHSESFEHYYKDV